MYVCAVRAFLIAQQRNLPSDLGSATPRRCCSPCSMPGAEMALDDYEMKVDVRAAINNILEQYPDGQILSEALQNAEDVGAGTFRIVLDLRTHDVESDPTCKGVNRDYCRGPAFVLIDDGAGFRSQDWGALYKIFGSHVSKHTPGDIGRFGMGTRSYFAYTDVITVVSNGQYRTLDPLELSGSTRWKHWAVDVEANMPNEAAVFHFPTFGIETLADVKGAIFRLPLRPEKYKQVDKNHGGFGPAVSPEDARNKMHRYVAQLARQMFFLSNVRTIELWQWDAGAGAPTRLGCVSSGGREYLPTHAGGALSKSFSRVPAAIR